MAKSNKKKIAVGVGLSLAAAAAAAGAGYYFYGSKHAAGNRKRAAAWAEDFKADVVAKTKKLKKFDERAYRVAVDEAMKAYANVRTIDKKDLARAAAELKGNWQAIAREAKRVAKADKRIVHREVKKAVRTVKRVIPRKLGKKKKS
ncbi:MAG: hypothetical protein A3C93_01620 [Candidatus Lloydbacteria bacterium RIFCSPHIGHO2_02_FULL_54_17]|uniref:Uncharacterized protein n=1 Tax=Candidatus Lloydbacteria bacterium RIFCSPHIGHO2_02_FULL_54_17 TaxID=1798664 RepID=A0A1G2DBZ0_9BACT|nr:MAG: hypothetical protein A3C93_01620 [Candidatus Lloydbacteria bacterium RIFCSPHIGHO2_02_FULL_54_17]OGZ14452.1 MAG: hypothetical protein A3H76_06135 [Candidatus Lloydbacteria bacterium RIFCSPLOWO2_02_FULL_54_12]OGZ15468.1 MAG: hypothetical protein A2948_02740 [Candidatus Lloydbacteria bacterium RIFCSPLOWO2_01_FULL_54_18]